MKKLFLSFAVIAGMSMISCGNKAADAADAEATDTLDVELTADTLVVADSLAGDSVATDTIVAETATVAE